MSYKTGEAAILTLIQALSAWNTNNSVSLANDSTQKGEALANKGKAAFYCFLRPGAFESDWNAIDFSQVLDTWQTIIEIRVLKAGVTEAPESKLTTLRQDILEALDKRHRLNTAGVVGAKITGGSEIIDGGTKERAFITQEMTLIWQEERSVVQAD